jgi:hypothetical protein
MGHEVFVIQHIIAAGVFLWLLWVHVPSYVSLAFLGAKLPILHCLRSSSGTPGDVISLFLRVAQTVQDKNAC